MTIPDTIFDTINDNWGAGGYAGAAPAIDTTETQTSSDKVTANVIEVRAHTLRERGEQKNDVYVNRHYTIDVYISTKTSAAQLTLLYDEVEYLLRNTAMTGIQIEHIDKDWGASEWEEGLHATVMRVAVVALLSDGAVTSAAGVTASMQALLMYTSANAAWVPMVPINADEGTAWRMTNARVINTGGIDFYMDLLLPIPCAKGTLKLYLKSLKYGLYDADADDYLTTVEIRAMNLANIGVVLDTDSTNHTTTGDKTFAGATFPAAVLDVSGYQSVMVGITVVATTNADFDLINMRMQCYYDT